MSVLYIAEQGASLHKGGKRLLVVKDGKTIQEVRIHEVERVIIFGNVQLTCQAMALLLNEGVEVSFLSMKGRFKGRLSPADSKNILLRLAQYKRYLEDDFRISISRSIIRAKIRNSRYLLLRYRQNHAEADLDEEIKRLESSLPSVDLHETISALMGVEGEAAAAYFRAYGKMLRRELRFSVRTRRPPLDPVNALLSLGYSLLTSEVAGILAAHGLDIYIGYLHEIDHGRPSLALDMVEEFRQPIVDRLTLSLVNKRVFTGDDFENREGGGVYLKTKSLKRYLHLYERTTSYLTVLEMR
ncbi:CRISPR-associated endonuclease Cas1 [Candidatus Poribacteria bacterium]|nr:CRISPR-associated endonuclease Cas1 [Candidatus Poribacteria bacterium]